MLQKDNNSNVTHPQRPKFGREWRKCVPLSCPVRVMNEIGTGMRAAGGDPADGPAHELLQVCKGANDLYYIAE